MLRQAEMYCVSCFNAFSCINTIHIECNDERHMMPMYGHLAHTSLNKIYRISKINRVKKIPEILHHNSNNKFHVKIYSISKDAIRVGLFTLNLQYV